MHKHIAAGCAMRWLIPFRAQPGHRGILDNTRVSGWFGSASDPQLLLISPSARCALLQSSFRHSTADEKRNVMAVRCTRMVFGDSDVSLSSFSFPPSVNDP